MPNRSSPVLAVVGVVLIVLGALQMAAAEPSAQPVTVAARAISNFEIARAATVTGCADGSAAAICRAPRTMSTTPTTAKTGELLLGIALTPILRIPPLRLDERYSV